MIGRGTYTVTFKNHRLVQKVLWLDCLGGLVVGAVVLLGCKYLSRWENLPVEVLMGLGVANLAYGGYSLFVTTRNPRSLRLIEILALANMSWPLVCLGLTCFFWQDITVLGLLHLIGEGIYVGGLGYTEWRLRFLLSNHRLPIGG